MRFQPGGCLALHSTALHIPRRCAKSSGKPQTAAVCNQLCLTCATYPSNAGAKSSGKPQTKTEPIESFFRWFTEVPEVRFLSNLVCFQFCRRRASELGRQLLRGSFFRWSAEVPEVSLAASRVQLQRKHV